MWPVSVFAPGPLIVVAATGAGRGEGWAREARTSDIHKSAPASAVEGSHVIPDRSLVIGLLAKAHETGRGNGFPLTVTNTARSDPTGLEGEDDGAFEHADAGAETGDGDCAGWGWGDWDMEPHI